MIEIWKLFKESIDSYNHTTHYCLCDVTGFIYLNWGVLTPIMKMSAVYKLISNTSCILKTHYTKCTLKGFGFF